MENEWVDFRLVKQSVTMQMVLDHYRINGLQKNGNELRGACPIHKGEGSRTFQVNVSKNVFQCFSCKVRGNVLDFVAALEGCTIREAALSLQSWFAIGESQSHRAESDHQSPTLASQAPSEEPASGGAINPPLRFQLKVDCGHDYGIGRGLSKETLDHVGAGLCVSKGTFAGRFVIPLHNAEGDLVGYAGRSIDDFEPKYLFPSSEKGFYKSHLLYNLHRVCGERSDNKVVVLVEGFFGCFKLTEAGYPSIALLGSSLSVQQEELICRSFNRVVLLFDGDEAGHGVTDVSLQRLGRKLWVKAIALPDLVQPDSLSEDELKTLLTRCASF